jgi:ribosomal protein S27E
MLRGESTEIECPECDRAVSVTFGQVASNTVVRCPGGHEIKLHDKGGKVRRAVSAGDELDRALKGLGGTIKF